MQEINWEVVPDAILESRPRNLSTLLKTKPTPVHDKYSIVSFQFRQSSVTQLIRPR
jgi:hypothetical protein